MTQYLTAAEYKKWFERRQIGFEHYKKRLSKWRKRFAELERWEMIDFPKFVADKDSEAHFDKKLEEIAQLFNKIDDDLLEATPRDFFTTQPLTYSEMFVENWKVFFDLLCKFCRRPAVFSGVYQEEKARADGVMKTSEFMKNLNQGIEMIGELEKMQLQVLDEERTRGLKK